MLHAATRATRIAFGVSVIAAVAFAPAIQAQKSGSSPNYELASAWTSQKVSKLVFDTSVTPRWLETSDRFWYTYQTRDGRRFHIVDPVKRTKGALFDHAKVAAALTTITRIPYDAQHLPFTQVRFIKGDSAFEFEVQVPRDASIETTKPKPITTEQQQGKGLGAGGPGLGARDSGTGEEEFPLQQGQRGRGAGAGAPPNPRTKRSISNTTWRRRG